MTAISNTTAPAAINAMDAQGIAPQQVSGTTQAQNATTSTGADSTKTTMSFVDPYQEKLDGYLDQLMSERKGLMDQAMAPLPTPPAKTDAEKAEVQGAIDATMAPYDQGANDNHGHNGRENQGLNAMRDAITDAAQYLSVDQTKQMLAGVKKLTDGIRGFSGTFEDAKNGGEATYMEVVHYASDFAKSYKSDFDQKLSQAQDQRDRAMQMLTNTNQMTSMVISSMEQNSQSASSLIKAFSTPGAIGNKAVDGDDDDGDDEDADGDNTASAAPAPAPAPTTSYAGSGNSLNIDVGSLASRPVSIHIG